MIALRRLNNALRRLSTRPRETPRSPRPLAVRILLAVAGLNLVVIAFVVLFLADYAASERKHAWTTAENLNRALDAGLEGYFSQINLVLETIADEYLRQMRAGGVDAAATQSLLDREMGRLPDIEGLRVADAGGYVRFASKQAIAKPINITDRDYFQRLRDDPSVGMFISKPEFGRLSGKWIAIFARRLSNPDGSFGGEAHVAVPTAAFGRNFSALDVGPHGVVSLWNDSPATVARFPEVANPGGVLALRPAAVSATRANPSLGTLQRDLSRQLRRRRGHAHLLFPPDVGVSAVSDRRPRGSRLRRGLGRGRGAVGGALLAVPDRQRARRRDGLSQGVGASARERAIEVGRVGLRKQFRGNGDHRRDVSHRRRQPVLRGLDRSRAGGGSWFRRRTSAGVGTQPGTDQDRLADFAFAGPLER